MPSPDASLLARVLALYPVFAGAVQPEVARDLGTLGAPLRLPDATVVFDAGAPCQGFPLLLAGAIRVARGVPQGRLLELYRVVPGEVCVVSTSCVLAQTPLMAHATTTAATEAIVVPPAMFLHWARHAEVRAWIFGVFATRLADLVGLAEAVAFQRLDQRLAAALLGHGQALHTTHQRLADELGTVREIVSRWLGRFEAAGWVRLGRERIEVLDPVALRSVAAGGLEPARPDAPDPA